MAKLILIRHGETNVNVKSVLHKYEDLEKLNKVGIKQINRTAKAIEKHNPSIIYSSKEKRAVQSAEIISKQLNIPLKLIEGMQERNWGELSGKKWPEIQQILDSKSPEERYNYKPPSGESWKTFESRLKKSLREILNKKKNQTVVVITHGGAIRALMPFLLKKPKEESFKYDPANASITILEFNKGKFTPTLINNTKHLED